MRSIAVVAKALLVTGELELTAPVEMDGFIK